MINMDNPKNIKVAIYCRVSTTEQAEEGYSIGEQERLLIEFCEKNGYSVYQVYSDAGISGKDIKHRPAMQKMLTDATQKLFNMVISWKINRISRKLSDAIKIVETLEKYGITYRSYSEPFESTTPAGKMQFQMMALIGEFERSTIAQNVKMGMCAKARNGEWCGGLPPLGYKWIPMEGTENTSRKKSRLEIDETEAETVKLIYELYASGKGYKAIANQINKLGYKTKLGNTFSVAQLRSILTNPVYIGKVRFNVRRDWNEKRRHNINPDPIITDGIHKAIIDEELWNRVQLMISQKSGKPSRIYDGEYPLTGILKCPECGAGMVISRCCGTYKNGKKKRIDYYACGAWKNKGSSVCHSNMVRVDKVNAVVFQELEKIVSNERILQSIVKKINADKKKTMSSVQQDCKQYEKELQKYDNRKKKVFELYEENLITKAEFINRKEEISSAMTEIQVKYDKAIQTLTDEDGTEVPFDFVWDVLKNFNKVLMSEEVERGLKKQLLHMIISEITLDNRREIDSIHIKLTDELVNFLQNSEGTPQEGVPSNHLLKELGIPVVNMRIII